MNVGPLTTILTAEANGRTRVVLEHRARWSRTQTRVEGDSVYVTIGEGRWRRAPPRSPRSRRHAAAASPRPRAGERAISNIDFRRGPDGAGQVVVELNDPRTTVDVRQEGGRIVVDFQDTTLPTELMRRLDVTDFATPVFTVDALRANRDARLVVTAAAAVRPGRVPVRQPRLRSSSSPGRGRSTAAQPGSFDEDREYTGERLTLNFQDIETRAVLQLLADIERPEHRRQRHGAGQRHAAAAERAVGPGPRHRDDHEGPRHAPQRQRDHRRAGGGNRRPRAGGVSRREQALQELEPLRSEFIQVNYAKASRARRR